MVLAVDLRHPLVTAALSAAATATGMEVVFIGGLTEETFTFQRVHGEWPGIADGLTLDRSDSFCARLLDGAPASTPDAVTDPAYSSVPAIIDLGVRSYVGVQIRDAGGNPVGTLCGIDHGTMPVSDVAVDLLRDLARVIGLHLDAAPEAGLVIRRTPAGWRVENAVAAADAAGNGDNAADAELLNAMILADLLADGSVASGRPQRPDGVLDEKARLQLSVAQLEHALAARVVVEQAIGVLAERQRLPPRAAFERLRKAARSRGRRVHELAREVVASSHAPGVPLPPELAGRRG